MTSGFSLRKMVVPRAYRNPDESFRLMMAWYADRVRQNLANNLWGYNPGELDRWADDGGTVTESGDANSPPSRDTNEGTP